MSTTVPLFEIYYSRPSAWVAYLQGSPELEIQLVDGELFPQHLADIHSRYDWVPLFEKQGLEDQLPFAWRSDTPRLVVREKDYYRSDLRWTPLYLARMKP